MNQEQRILQLLRDAGERGVSNFDLMQIAFQYPARIHSLRHKHDHEITSIHVSDKEWRITLTRDADVPKAVPKAVSWLFDDEVDDQPSVQRPLF